MTPMKRISSEAASGRTISTDPALARGSFDFYNLGLYKSNCPIQAENHLKYKLQASSCHVINLVGNLTICVKRNAFLESFLDST